MKTLKLLLVFAVTFPIMLLIAIKKRAPFIVFRVWMDKCRLAITEAATDEKV